HERPLVVVANTQYADAHHYSLFVFTIKSVPAFLSILM
ncbi:hypothetical protein LTSEHVI_4890, partial [Salmonella enterica subsp. enterica serovar Hvittingfoss str. A4-620]